MKTKENHKKMIKKKRRILNKGYWGNKREKCSKIAGKWPFLPLPEKMKIPESRTKTNKKPKKGRF